MQVRYCRLFAYVIEIHPLIYDACTNCKKSDHSYVFALNVPYCTCQSPNLTQKRFAYLITYCYVLCSTFSNTCLHYYNRPVLFKIIGISSEFSCKIIQVVESLLFFMRMLEFFCTWRQPSWMCMHRRYYSFPYVP